MSGNYLNDQHRMWKYILFGILTLGIYDIIFMWGMIEDMNTACGRVEETDREDSPNFIILALLSLVTLGIYGLIWYYRQGNRLQKCGSRYHFVITENGNSYLLWTLVGVLLFGIGPFITLYLFICNVNKVCSGYNSMLNAPPETGEKAESGADAEGDNLLTGPDQEEPGRFDYTGSDDDPTTSGALGVLVGISGGYKGCRFPLAGSESLTLGRNRQQSQLIFTDPDISRVHCKIRFDFMVNGFMVTDLSTYGTFLNDTIRLKKGVETKCPVGSKLSLGNGNNAFMLR